MAGPDEQAAPSPAGALPTLDTGARVLGTALASGAILGTLGIASATALDVAIDRSGHDHDSLAYKLGSVPTYALAIGAGGLLAAGVGAMALGAPAAIASGLLGLAVGTAGAWAATFGVRVGIGMLFDPDGTRFNPGDIAKNSIDRTHMMARTSRASEAAILDVISRAQGHGDLESRHARGDFEPLRRPAP